MGQQLRIAFRNLVKHRTRTLLMGGAIGAVTMILVLLLALTAGIQGTILNNATALATGHVNIAGFFKISQSSAAPMVTHFKPLQELAKKHVPEARFIYDRVKSYGKVISDTGSVMIPVWGIQMENEKEIIGHLPMAKKSEYIENYKTAPGEPESEGNLLELSNRGTLAIFASHAKKLGVKVGDPVTLSMPTYRNMNNTKDVRVVAILADMGIMSAFAAFMHHEDTRDLYQQPAGSTGQIMIALKDPTQTPVVEERLRKLIAEHGQILMDKEAQPYWMKFDRVVGESWTGQRIDVTTWQDETAYVKWVMDLLNALTFVATGVLMIIVVLGLVNTLWMSIRERTTEVGTLRAIGLQRRQVLTMFLLESLILSFGAIGTGVLAGSILAALVNAAHVPISESFQLFLMSNVLTLTVRAQDLIFTFVVLSFFLAAGSLIPAYRASRMKPITALGHVS